MKNSKLINFLKNNLNITEIDTDDIIQDLDSLVFKKNDFLVKPGEKCTNIFFVINGLLRQYSVDAKGKEHNLAFAPEEWFITDRASMFFNEPTNFYIQAIEETEVILLSENFFTNISVKYPQFVDFNTKLLHNHVRHQQNRINSLLSESAEERYLDFIKIYPDLILRIPQTMISSYLGITPESLSRVRRELAHKNK